MWFSTSLTNKFISLKHPSHLLPNILAFMRPAQLSMTYKCLLDYAAIGTLYAVWGLFCVG